LKITLTKKGLKEVDQVIQNVFNYINLMKEKRLQDDHFNEDQKSGELDWDFITKEDPYTTTEKLVE